MIQVFITPIDKELSFEYKRQAIEKVNMERQIIAQNRAKVMSDYVIWDKYENIVAINKRNGKILFSTKSYI